MTPRQEASALRRPASASPLEALERLFTREGLPYPFAVPYYGELKSKLAAGATRLRHCVKRACLKPAERRVGRRQ